MKVKVVHKKDRNVCGNYHDISLVAHADDILVNIADMKPSAHREAKGLPPGSSAESARTARR